MRVKIKTDLGTVVTEVQDMSRFGSILALDCANGYKRYELTAENEDKAIEKENTLLKYGYVDLSSYTAK